MRRSLFLSRRLLPQRASLTCKSGMTLVELTVAIAIAAALAVVLFSLYRTVSHSAEGQQARLRGEVAVARALREIAHDLTLSLPVYGHTEGGLVLFTSEGPRGPASRVAFAVPRLDQLPGDGSELRWFRAVAVEYRLDPVPGGRGRLVRLEKPLIGPEALQPATTNIVVEGIDQFHVFMRGESEWVDEYQSDARAWDQLDWPRAARIRLVADRQTRGQREHEIEVLIPAGWTFQPEE